MSLVGAAAQQGNAVVGYKTIDCYRASNESRWISGVVSSVRVYAVTVTTIAGAYSTSTIIYSDSLGTEVASSGYYGDTAGGEGSTASVWDNGTSTWTSQTAYNYSVTGFYAVDGDGYCVEGASPVTVYTENPYGNFAELFPTIPIYAAISGRTSATNGNYGDTSGGGGSGQNYEWRDGSWGAPTDCPA